MLLNKAISVLVGFLEFNKNILNKNCFFLIVSNYTSFSSNRQKRDDTKHSFPCEAALKPCRDET